MMPGSYVGVTASRHDAKLDDPVGRYIATTFCYGYNFGPTQTARSVRGLDRRQVSFVNQRHVTEQKLNEAIDYIALFSRFSTCSSWEGHYIWMDFVTEEMCRR